MSLKGRRLLALQPPLGLGRATPVTSAQNLGDRRFAAPGPAAVTENGSNFRDLGLNPTRFLLHPNSLRQRPGDILEVRGEIV